MKMLTVRHKTFCLLACASCVLLATGCVRPTLVNGGNNGPNPLDGFDGPGNGSDNSGDDPIDSNGSEDDDPGPVNQLNPFGLEVLFTDVQVDPSGWIQTGDDLIVVGTGVGSGVQYLIPSDPNPVATDISEIELFAVSGFAVTGKWIILRNLEGEVFVFDVDTASLTAINPDEFAVTGGIATDSPNFRADGDYVAAIMNRERTTDDFLIKLLKLEGSGPEIINIMENPPGTSDPFETFEAQVALDANRVYLAAQVNDHIYFYSNFFSELAPLSLDFTTFGGVSNQKPMWLDDANLMYLSREQSPEGNRIVYVARLNLGVTSPLPVNPASFDDFILNNGQFGYFAVQNDSDRLVNRQARSVFGRIIANELSVNSDAVTNLSVGDDRDDGTFGFGQSLSMSPNGEYRFLAGGGAEDAADLLQISKDVTWQVFNDPRATDDSDPLLRATDVSASDSVCAFVTGADRNIGYILLD
ncbi:MAG: hypothetical protein DHS20C16_32350 [Phycisphaerae bacterium]|nr:MAG: hypothetical protein DHS20C16_32350 [Phycisphaerae bacterium]